MYISKRHIWDLRTSEEEHCVRYEKLVRGDALKFCRNAIGL